MARAGKTINLAELLNADEEAIQAGIEFDDDEFIHAMSMRMAPENLFNDVSDFFKIDTDQWTRQTAEAFREARAIRNAHIIKSWRLKDPITEEEYSQPWKNADVFKGMPEPLMGLLERAIAKAYEMPEAKREAVGED